MSGKIIRNRGGSIFVVFVDIPPPNLHPQQKEMLTDLFLLLKLKTDLFTILHPNE